MMTEDIKDVIQIIDDRLDVLQAAKTIVKEYDRSVAIHGLNGATRALNNIKVEIHDKFEEE